VTIVLNNKAWGMCVHGQQSMYGGNRLVATELGETRYDRVAAGFGCHAEHVDDPDAVAGAVRRALASKRPACVNIMTDLDVAFGTAAPSRSRQESDIEMPYYGTLKQD
jgi:acetolactate synthase I/II/III large subunit